MMFEDKINLIMYAGRSNWEDTSPDYWYCTWYLLRSSGKWTSIFWDVTPCTLLYGH